MFHGMQIPPMQQMGIFVFVVFLFPGDVVVVVVVVVPKIKVGVRNVWCISGGLRSAWFVSDPSAGSIDFQTHSQILHNWVVR